MLISPLYDGQLALSWPSVTGHLHCFSFLCNSLSIGFFTYVGLDFFLSLEKLMCTLFLQDYGIDFDDDDQNVALFWCKYGSKFCSCCKCGCKLCRNIKRSNSKFNLPFYVMCISLFYFQHDYSIPTPWPSLLRLKILFAF